ncbi:hypothetical protein LQ567_18695 [Niabella pedocola]|uniref:Outer membrane protein beta-barrel domain-containing protein n=1 Tax=Niabella pedocola TaxID=1752077 RepID=A0ABS8PUT2_9BACT|nr:hypothetical protein [Niabella pedocola]MCD2424818.1 hypothetical protein [Niabella pedocola]
MKKYALLNIFIVTLLLTVTTLHAQTLNWSSLNKSKQLIHTFAGAEYGLVFGVGYSYKLPVNSFPLLVTAEYSFPSGGTLTDDFKTKIGGQIPLIKLDHFRFAVKAQGIFRRYENDLVRLANWGVDVSGTIGYYRPRWFAGAEAGLDKAIATHFKHSNQYKNEYRDVKDGWFEPATGGNFYYGLQTGISFQRYDLTLKGGNVLAQDFKSKPILPFFAQVGCNFRF